MIQSVSSFSTFNSAPTPPPLSFQLKTPFGMKKDNQKKGEKIKSFTVTNSSSENRWNIPFTKVGFYWPKPAIKSVSYYSTPLNIERLQIFYTFFERKFELMDFSVYAIKKAFLRKKVLTFFLQSRRKYIRVIRKLFPQLVSHSLP